VGKRMTGTSGLPRPQFFRWAKPCSSGTRTAARALSDSFCPRVSGQVPGGPVAGDHRRIGVGTAVVEPDESQVGDGSEAGRPQPDREPVVTAGGDLRGTSGPGRRAHSSRPLSPVSAISSRDATLPSWFAAAQSDRFCVASGRMMRMKPVRQSAGAPHLRSLRNVSRQPA
jgi:hypothetical protein